MAKPLTRPHPKALLFDLMGTCVDWHSSIVPALTTAFSNAALKSGKASLTEASISHFALRWRQGFFDATHRRFAAGLPPEEIDITHRRVLETLLEEDGWRELTEEDLEACVRAWHEQSAWADVASALPRLREKMDVVVHANGTTRLQLDITKSSGLSFDMLFSSALLGTIKPSPESYHKVISLLQLKPEQCMMVAAHAYDLRGAKDIGMRTAYVQRWTEDPQEDMASVRAENDIFIDGRTATGAEGGLLSLAEMLGC